MVNILVYPLGTYPVGTNTYGRPATSLIAPNSGLDCYERRKNNRFY